MANRFVLNETSYHGAGAIAAIVTEAQNRGFKKALVCSDPALITFGVTAKVTDRIELRIAGDNLIHDNADAVSRIERIIQRSRISTREKEHMMAQVLSDAPTHKKLSHMHWPSSESEAVVDAIKELLSLTECEYLGSQL